MTTKGRVGAVGALTPYEVRCWIAIAHWSSLSFVDTVRLLARQRIGFQFRGGSCSRA